MKEIKVIAFDADDTLWENEIYFRETENQLAELLKKYASKEQVIRVLFEVEMSNLSLYGYGVKSCVLSMMETALKLSNNQLESSIVASILELGKQQLNQPVTLLGDIKEVLDCLYKKYRLVLATKGDLLDQERKLHRSGLESYFHHIEIMSEKRPENYAQLVHHLDCKPKNFLMIGNSLKSDILPVLEIGGKAAYIPHSVTWEHEKIEKKKREKLDQHFNFVELKKIMDILTFIE